MPADGGTSQVLPMVGLNEAVSKLVRIGAISAGDYKTGWFLPIQGPSDPVVVRAALDAIVARHEALRATIDLHGQSPCERLYPSATCAMDVVDLRGAPGAIELAAASAENFLGLPAEALSLPTVKCRAIRIGDNEWLLALNCPTWFVDGWSIFLLSAELRTALEDRDVPKFLSRKATPYSETLTEDSSASLVELTARTGALCRQDVRQTSGLLRQLPRWTRLTTWLGWKVMVASVQPIVARLLEVIAPAAAFVRRSADTMSERRKRRVDESRRPVPAPGRGGSPVRRIVVELPSGSAAVLRAFAVANRCTLTSVCVASVLQTIAATLGQQEAYLLNVFGRRSPRTFGTVGGLTDADFVELDRSLARSDLETVARSVSKQVMMARGIARCSGRISGSMITDEQRGMISAGFNRLFHPWELFVLVEMSPGVAVDVPIAGMTLDEWAASRLGAERPPAATDRNPADVRISPPRRAETAHLELLRLVPHLVHISFDVVEGDVLRVELHYDCRRFRDDGIMEFLRACVQRLGDASDTLSTENAAP